MFKNMSNTYQKQTKRNAHKQSVEQKKTETERTNTTIGRSKKTETERTKQTVEQKTRKLNAHKVGRAKTN